MSNRSRIDSFADEKTPVDRVRLPVNNFRETKKYKKIFQSVADKNIVLLHCHGVPGSGKSEVVRKLAELFPFTQNGYPELHVKWHIQCNDSGHNVKTELKTLVDEISNHNLLPVKWRNNVQSIQKEIVEDYATQLTHALFSVEVPVLIVIEDINPKSKKFLKDFFRSIDKVVSSKHKFHIYTTSRRKKIILQENEWSEMKNYQVETIQGFEKDEGVQFLMHGLPIEKDTTSAENVCDMFSGSPLALCAAKTYCLDTSICYSEYLQWIKEYNFEDDESEDKESVKNEYGNSALSVFQAIAKPFHVKNGLDYDTILMWKVLSCLTHLHYDRIPFNVVQQCCIEVGETDRKKGNLHSKINAGKIIDKLRDHGMCTVTDEKEVTFHEVVMRAFQHNHFKDSPEERLGSLKAAIYVIARIITKDVRERVNDKIMGRLIRHVQSLLQHVEEEQNIYNGPNQQLLCLLVSHIYESLGAIVSSKAPQFRYECNSYFEKAFQLLWKNDSRYSLTSCNNINENAEAVAKYVVENCKLAGNNLPYKFIETYESKLNIVLDHTIKLEFERKLKEIQQIVSIDDVISTWSPLQIIEELRKCDLFLDEASHRLVFFAEKLASIFHSWSRWILYVENPKVKEYDQYIWFTTLSLAISVECRKKYKVGLLTEHIAITGGMLSLTLKMKPGLDKLLEAKAKCEGILSANKSEHFPAYEHGFLKVVDGTTDPFIQIQMHRNLVRIYTRLVVNPDGAKFIPVGNTKCAALMNLIKSDHSLTNATMCIVYCAKYYAASGDLDKSIDSFHFYFKQTETNPQIKPVHTWAIYNYCRAVLLGNRICEKELAICKVQKVLCSAGVIPDDLNHKVNECLYQLSNLKVL